MPGIEGSGANFELAADERDPRLVVVADLSGVLLSRDGGCRWDRSLSFDSLLPASAVDAEDVEVAGTGADRSLNVLVDPSEIGRLQLLSSFDDGRTWSARDLPPLGSQRAVASVDLVASPASPTLFVFARTAAAAGAIYAGTPSSDGWRWNAVTQGSPAAGACAPDGPCAGPTLDALLADPMRDETLWAFGRPEGLGDVALVRSDDGGATWNEVAAPGVAETTALFDVAPGRNSALMLLGIYDDFAVSRDGGRSWVVGRLPELVADSVTSRRAFELAHFDRGKTFATVLGLTEESPWAGNVLVFDGLGWKNVSPAELAGYDRTDEQGRRLAFVELAGTRGPLLALTSRGDLMTYRR